MRAIVQRVSQATVQVKSEIVGSIGAGLCVFIGLHRDDSDKDMEYLCRKILGLRVFDDAEGVMNLSVSEIEGEILFISQFTLYGDVRKGKRPSYSTAMEPERANTFFNSFVGICKKEYSKIETGSFGDHMNVSLINNGPITIMLDSCKTF